MGRPSGRYDDLHQLVEGISVEDVGVMDLLTCKTSDEPAKVLALMEDLDIDVIPVEEPDGTFGRYLLRDDLRHYLEASAASGGLYRDVVVADLIPGTASLHDALPLLNERFWLLILEGNKIQGIVTRGDLQKSPMRMYLFGLFTLLETYLLTAINNEFPEDSWQTLDGYPNKFFRYAKGEYKSRTSGGEKPLTLAECLSIGGKLAVVRQHVQWHEALGIDTSSLEISRDSDSNARADDFLSDLVTLRTSLAHANDLTHDLEDRWRTIFRLVNQLERLTARVETLGEDAAGS